MKKRGKPTTKREDSCFESAFTAFQFIGAFSLSQLLEYPYNYLIILAPLLAVEGVLVGFYLLKLKKKFQPAEPAAVDKNLPMPEAPKSTPKPKAIVVEKAEVINDTLKFSVLKGFLRRRWVVVKEIPLYEITLIETAGNELNITWNDATASFVMKKKAASFEKLPEQVNAMIEEHRKMLESNEKSALRRSELLGAINASIGTVDLSFDILASLHVKRINWQQLEDSSKGFGNSLNFIGKTLPPLSLDFSGIAGAIERQVPKETSKEVFSILKSIYGYFNGLNPEEDINETHPNFKNAKDAISAYYTLNDLLLGKIAGDKDSKKESLALETILQSLAKESDVRVNFEELMGNINKMSLDDRESVIQDSREIFKEQLKNIDHQIEQPLIVQQPPIEEAPVAQPEPVPLPEPEELPQPATQQPAAEQQQVVQTPPEPAPMEQPEAIPSPSPIEPMEPAKPPEPAVEPPVEPAVVEPQRASQPSPEPSSMEQQEPEQAEVTIPETETTTKPSEPPPKKKSLTRRLRKTILGY